MVDTLSPAQIRGARAMLDWSLLDLARAAGVSVAAAKRVQDGVDTASTSLDAVQTAFETEGVRFLPNDGNGSGLRLSSSAVA